VKDNKIKGELIGDRVIVWDPKEGSKLYAMGYYGKPIGIPKPKTPDFNVPLVLDLIESLYLMEKGVLRVVNSKTRRPISPKAFRRKALSLHERFNEKYCVYKDLREKNFVVTPGIKFGCDFAVYEHGPGIDHAPFLVEVRRTQDSIKPPEIVRAGRLATTVRKRFIFAVFDPITEEITYLVFKWWKA